MNKALKILGAIFLAILISIAGMFGYAAFQGQKLDAESRAYLEATLPMVLADLRSENFSSFMAAEDRTKLNAAATDQFALKVRQSLGSFQSCDDLKGDSLATYTPSGVNILGKYVASCHYENGSVMATITLRKVGASWSLMSVNFDNSTLKRTTSKI
jgi:hypothetical protein